MNTSVAKELELNDLFDKVIYVNGRVWTIYATTGKCENEAIWAFEGVKPYPHFKFDSNSDYHSEKYLIAYVRKEEAIQGIIEGEEIEKCLKKVKTEEKKKLTRKKAIDFFSYLTGHTKSFISKNIVENFNGFGFAPGQICYGLWKMDGILYLSHNTNNGYTEHSYYDFITFRPDDRFYEKKHRAYEEEIIDRYKEWKGIE